MKCHYSDGLVALARAIDRADVAVRAARWHFSEMEMDYPERYFDRAGAHPWTRGNIESLEASLPGLRAMFVSCIRKESPDMAISLNIFEDAIPPAELMGMFNLAAPRIKSSTQSVQPNQLISLPLDVSEFAKTNRVVFFEDEIYVIDDNFTDSFVEVWFRRSFGGWPDGGAHPLYLDKRPYGWQAYGIER